MLVLTAIVTVLFGADVKACDLFYDGKKDLALYSDLNEVEVPFIESDQDIFGCPTRASSSRNIIRRLEIGSRSLSVKSNPNYCYEEGEFFSLAQRSIDAFRVDCKLPDLWLPNLNEFEEFWGLLLEQLEYSLQEVVRNANYQAGFQNFKLQNLKSEIDSLVEEQALSAAMSNSFLANIEIRMNTVKAGMRSLRNEHDDVQSEIRCLLRETDAAYNSIVLPAARYREQHQKALDSLLSGSGGFVEMRTAFLYQIPRQVNEVDAGTVIKSMTLINALFCERFVQKIELRKVLLRESRELCSDYQNRFNRCNRMIKNLQ